ncbi:hypothetical protein ABZW51_29280, partial [Streptomyces cellulosae]
MTASAPGTAAPRLLGTLLPAWAAGAELRGGAGPQPWLYEEEDEQLGEDAVPKRWQEFARARMCARRALAAVGAGAGPLLRGPHGAMSLAPAAYTLFQKVMRHDPADADWVGRDRF